MNLHIFFALLIGEMPSKINSLAVGQSLPLLTSCQQGKASSYRQLSKGGNSWTSLVLSRHEGMISVARWWSNASYNSWSGKDYGKACMWGSVAFWNSIIITWIGACSSAFFRFSIIFLFNLDFPSILLQLPRLMLQENSPLKGRVRSNAKT